MKAIVQLAKRFQTVLIALITVLGLTSFSGVAFATGPQVYLTPSSGLYQVGNSIAVQVRENSNGTAVNSAQAGITYPSSLQLVSINGAGSAFGNDVSPASTNSEVIISRFSTNSYTTDELVATVYFKVLSAGTANLSFTTSCQVNETSDCTGLGSGGSSIAITTSGSSYILENAPNNSGSLPSGNLLQIANTGSGWAGYNLTAASGGWI